VARPPIHGLPGLLPAELAWSYRSAARSAAPAPVSPGHRLVIAGVEPPPELQLPRVALAVPGNPRPGDVVLSGPGATPARALDEMAAAGFVEIHAHGLVNLAVSDASHIVLSPDVDGGHALTAGAIRGRRLRGAPVVILAACHAAVTATYLHEAWSLPTAFLDAGARAVVASPDAVPDAQAGAFFDALRARIDRGEPPAAALRDARLEWSSTHGRSDWVRSLVVFE
jgi:CHAT domain-containing protein